MYKRIFIMLLVGLFLATVYDVWVVLSGNLNMRHAVGAFPAVFVAWILVIRRIRAADLPPP